MHWKKAIRNITDDLEKSSDDSDEEEMFLINTLIGSFLFIYY